MDPFTTVANLPTNSQGEITILPEHLDQNHKTIVDTIRMAYASVLEAGGALAVGSVTVESSTIVRAQGWMGVTLDGAMGVRCDDQTVDVSAVDTGIRMLLVIDVAAGELLSYNFVDADTAENLSHQLMAYPGRLRIIEGDNVNLPAASPDVLPIAELTRTGGGVTVDSLITTRPRPAAWIRARAVSTANRPSSPVTGDSVFDTTLGQPVWWDGSGWVDAGGAPA